MRPRGCRLRSGGLLGLALGLTLLGLPLGVPAQDVPPGALEQLDTMIGNRIEALAILGSQNGVSGGTYLSNVNDTAIEVVKLTGRGDMSSPKPLGDSGVGWNLLLEGGIGRGTFNNRFDTNQLQGNDGKVDTFSLALGAGVRFTFWERLSVAPTFGVIYSHTEQEFTARTDAGRAVLARFNGTLVNWDADTYTLVPGIEGRFRQPLGPIVLLELTSMFKYFDTRPIQRSTQALSFESQSQWWRNEVDVDFRLPLWVFERQLRTGVTFARSELYEGLRETFHSDHIYDVGGRLVVDLLGALWKVEWLGIGGAYLWGEDFSGWTIGADIRLKF